MHTHEFEDRVFRLKDRLFRFALMWLKRRDDADDAVQEIMARLWTIRKKLHDLLSIEGYAIQMMRNECINRLNSKSRNWASLDEVSEQKSEQHPEREFQREETLQTLLRLIAGLPEQQQLVIMLRDLEGLEIGEIEAISGMTANNVRVTLSLARKKIAERYKAHEGYERK